MHDQPASVTHGKFRITDTETIISNDDFVEKEFLLEKITEKEKSLCTETKRIRHLQFKTWPNYGLPDAVGPISDFVAHVYNRSRG